MTRLLTRRAVLAGIGVASLAGCLGGGRVGGSGDSGGAGGSGDTGERSSAEPGENGEAPSGEPSGGESAPPTRDARLPLPMEPSALRNEAVSGGPPKDGIPAIERPKFVSADEASADLDPGDPVFGIAMGGEPKAYPQSILVAHEICNDVVDGTPVSVTYCPLTGTAMGFERGETTFGVSGRLVNNNLIMYDRATETWWPQVLSTAIPGPWNENPEIRSLREFRVVWTTWERWTNRFPETRVLSRDTGFAKNYDRDPYGSYNPRAGYYAPEARPMFRSLSEDDRLQPKRVVIGARTPGGAAAFEKDTLREEKLIDGQLGGTPVLAVYEPTLDTGYVYENPDEAAFEHRDGRVLGENGDAHAPDALPLKRVLAFDAMWFAWSGFYPDTTLYT
ncbi:DUF3179 domain-containing protein [Halobellus rarus]|uniref:DUF3179 domain-containing protein n=1 Tax=Halobellus rarus TaxID=1126237 RepID=A0ABD6CNE9_9EURY|nr:DUF3179 domain-containing protein [Halobellus rarus]